MSYKMIYTKTDEAPALATASLLPIVQRFTKTAGIDVELRDISLAGRILAQFPENLSPAQKVHDDLTYLGALAETPDANMIKLPNISASVPQLQAAVKELQSKGYKIPDYPENPQNDQEKEIKLKYSKVLGSAVNPVLREGNSDRRVALSVKKFAQNNPHSMGAWSKDSKSHVAAMTDGDFYGSEKSYVTDMKTGVKIQWLSNDGTLKILKDKIQLLPGEVIDASVMSMKKLRAFLTEQKEDARQKGVLYSLHLKATMMKVSDPVMFGAALETFFAPVFSQFSNELKDAGVDSKNGLAEMLYKIEKLPAVKKEAVLQTIHQCLNEGPDLAMVDSDKGITNLHVPSDVIIDASMPAAIRSSGKMWNNKGQLQDMKAIIPDRCYASVYQATIDFCKTHGAFDPRTMGSVANVGLMAKKAEEYGSHDKTFVVEADGRVQVVNSDNNIIFDHKVEKGDIWRMCQTKDEAIKDWVKLAVTRARASGQMAIFWLDPNRAHDSNLIQKVNRYLKDHDTRGLEIKILSPEQATLETLQREKAGKDTISVTGNVLRDYLTDLFPILELGTSAKMLSIVPLLAGGGLYETGAGGTAPKHVQQFLEENHLRWDSLGEFLALAVSLEDLGNKTNDPKITVLAKTLDEANSEFLKQNKSPSRKIGDIDNRGSHFYLALYWSQALARQSENVELQQHFKPLADQLTTQEKKIVEELIAVQGRATDIGGYFHPSDEKLSKVMRPSATFNQVLS